MKYTFLYLPLCFTVGLAIASCNGSGSKNQQLQEEILAAHDSIMPKMGEFVRDELKIGILSNKMDSLKALYPDLDTLKEKEALLDLQGKLKVANESMSDWMHQYEPEQQGKGSEEIQKYLEGELAKVRKLNETFSQAEKASQDVLAKYK